MDYYYYNGELYHHGISGQKWGVKNGPPYPLDSGSASKSNAKRKLDTGKIKSKVSSAKNKISSKVSSSKGKAKETKENSQLKKMDVSKMTNEELKKATERMNLEANYNLAYNKLSSSDVSSGKKFAKYVEGIVSSSLKSVATEEVTKGLKKLLTKDDPDAELKKETERLKMESQKSTYENNIATNKEKAESRASSASAKSAGDSAKASREAAGWRYTSETAKPPSKVDSSSLSSTKTSSTRFMTNLSSSERAQVNEMRKQPYSSASTKASEGKKYVEVVDYSDLYRKKK